MESSVAMEHETAGAPATPDALIELVRSLAAELHPGRTAIPATLDHRLEQDYGFDSLARVELFLRIEKRFGVALPEAVMAGVETPRDLLRAIVAAGPAHHAPAAVLGTRFRTRRRVGDARRGGNVAGSAGVARAPPSRPPAHRAAGRGRRRAHRHLRRARPGRASRGGGPRRARPRAGPGGGDHAADERRVLLQLLRHPPRRGHPGPDLSARAPLADRGPPAASRGHPLQRPHGAARHRGAGQAARAAAQAARGDAARGDDAGGADAPGVGGDGASRARRKTSRCSSTPPAAPAIPRASFSPTPTCSATSARWGKRCR